MNFQCSKCDHVFGTEWPEQTAVEAHYHEMHGATGRVYSI